GLSKDLKITVGAIDAHHGAVGAGISPNILVKVMGTSTCDMLIAPKNMEEIIVDGICGQVDGSIIPDYIGYEAGKSAYGDVFQWIKQLQMKTMIDILGDTLNKEDMERLDERFFTILTEQASKLNPKQMIWFLRTTSMDVEHQMQILPLNRLRMAFLFLPNLAIFLKLW